MLRMASAPHFLILSSLWLASSTACTLLRHPDDLGAGPDSKSGDVNGGTGAGSSDSTGRGGDGFTGEGGIGNSPRPPFEVVEVVPNGSGVEPNPTVRVTFSRALVTGSATANTVNRECRGSLQLSKDAFSTCVTMRTQPQSSNGATSFSLKPAEKLDSLGEYQVRVTPEVADTTGALLSEFTSDPFAIRYHHSINIDGENDFTDEEVFRTSDENHQGYVAWDDKYLYLGMKGPDVASNSSSKWIVAYLGVSDEGGTDFAVQYGGVPPPKQSFNWHYHLRWRTDGDFTALLKHGSSSDLALALGEDWARSEDYVELRILFAHIGDPERLNFMMYMLDEEAGSYQLWAALPSKAFVNGIKPPFSKQFSAHFLFNFPSPAVPKQLSPVTLTH
jgi:hypothetical protein